MQKNYESIVIEFVKKLKLEEPKIYFENTDITIDLVDKNQNTKSAYILDLIHVVANVLGISNYEIKSIDDIHGQIKRDNACRFNMSEIEEIVKPIIINYMADNNV